MKIKLTPKIWLSLFLASFAAIGNIPYGYRFAHSLFTLDSFYIDILGYIFAIAAVLANVALGGYSLISINKDEIKGKGYVVLLSIIGAMPVGFICFLGYLKLLPIYVNIVLSINVSFVNAGIGLRAMLNVIEAFRNIKKGLKKKNSEILTRCTGFIAGTAVSTVGYVAAASSLVMLFLYLQMSEPLARSLSYLISLVTWLPSATLFAHSTQKVMGDIYESIFYKNKQKSKSQNIYLLIGIIVLSLLSATALTQMVIELFSPESKIPEFLKYEYMQVFIYKILTPVTFFSSASVNFFALKNLMKYLNVQK